MTMLRKLIGKKVVKISYINTATTSIDKKEGIMVESPISIVFEDYTLNIYNPFTIKGTDTDASLRIIENLTVIDCQEQPTEVTIELETNIELAIDLKDESFQGPEALSLYGPNNLIIVWN